MRKLLTLLFVVLIATTLHASISSGKCGDNLEWSYNSETTTLTITGFGSMYDYTIAEPSPFSFNQELTKVVLPEELTHIGDNAFYEDYALTSITIEATTPPTLITSLTISFTKSLDSID